MVIISNIFVIFQRTGSACPERMFSMATVSAPVKRVRRLRPAPLWLSLLLAFLAYFLLDLSLRLFYGSMSDVSLWAWQPLVFTLLWSGTMTAIAALLPRTGRRIFLLVTFVPFALLTITHCVLYQLTGTCFSFADLAYAGDGTRFISASYFRLRKGEWFSLAVCLAMMLCAVIFMPQTHVGRRGGIAAAVLAAACAAGILVVHTTQMPRGGIVEHNEYLAWNDAASHDTLSETYAEFTNANRCLMLTGLYQYTVRGAAVTLWPQDTATDQRIAELDDYYASHPKEAADTPMTGAFAGKNLILIMMESVDDWLVTPEYMPNLYRLEQEGVYFRNYYAPIFLAAATFNSEFTANTGMIAPEYQVRNSYYAEHALPYSLANLFRDAGYRARSYHAANPNIYNRGQIHLNFGYESYNDYGDLGMDDYMLDSQLLRGYDQIVSDEPFFSFIITYSGHGPYTTEQQNISEPHLDRARTVIDYSTVPYTTEAQKEEYTRAVAQAMETDAFIGGLRERLEADGHAEDTVLMLFTDHYCKYFSDVELISAIKGETDRNMLSNVPFVIWTEGITPQVSEKYVSTMDIAPTIVDLFSLDADLRYYIGNDMFGPDGGVVYFRNYAWYDGKTYDTGNDASSNPDVLAMREQVREQLNVSQDTFRYDYFAYLQRRGILNPDE
ncbi:MAG: LTA synthase family protein [Clostridiales bacterium]|nr:LTA synthase family protein [Clostridiales bacterium]